MIKDENVNSVVHAFSAAVEKLKKLHTQEMKKEEAGIFGSIAELLRTVSGSLRAFLPKASTDN